MKRLKCLLSLILCIIMLVTPLPMSVFAVNSTTETSFEGYIPISTKEDLSAIRNDLSAKYYLTNNIVFSESDFSEGGDFYNAGTGWSPIGTYDDPFVGVLDGNGYAVQNLKISINTSSTIMAGLFGFIEGDIFNLGMDNCSILVNVQCNSDNAANVYIGGIAARSDSYDTGFQIDNCYFSGNISVVFERGSTYNYGKLYVGGIIGQDYADIAINKCMNYGSIEVQGYNCEDDNEIYLGGILGYGNSTLSKCFNRGEVNAYAESDSSYGSAYTYVGGIAGNLRGDAKACINIGVVTATSKTADNSYICEAYSYAGGIAAYAVFSTITDSSNLGVVKAVSYPGDNGYRDEANAYAGGISGCGRNVNHIQGQIIGSNNSGKIIASAESNYNGEAYVGGISGYDSIITNCYNVGEVASTTVNAESFTGGISGKDGHISCCYNSGDVKTNLSGSSWVQGSYIGAPAIGGIIGLETCDNITNCFNSGEISVNISNTKLTTSSIGGIAGASDSNVNNCYNIGNINISDSPNSTLGGIVGGCQYITSDVADCYYLNTTKNGVGYGTDNATLCTNDQMKHSSTFNGFDFEMIWEMGDSDYPYPVLIDVPYNSNQSVNPTPNPDVPSVNTTLKYGVNRFAFGEDISGYVGDEIDTLIVYTSANENIASLDITSSNTNVVEIGTIEIGVGDYITSENEHIATIPLKLKAEGSTTITITSPEGISESVTVSVVKKVFVVPDDGGFSSQKNGWSFVNGEEGFGYDEYKGSYFIPAERYETVFGEEYVAAATVEQGTFNSMIPTTWGGNCYGMSVTSVLFYLGMLEWSYYDDLYENDFSNVNSYYNTLRYHSELAGLLKWGYASSDVNTSITNLIECYQVLQYGCKSGYKAEEGSTYTEMEENFMVFQGKIGVDEQKDVYEHNPRGNYISAIYDKIINTTEPLLVDMHGRLGGHAMVIRTDIAPVESGDGWYKIYVYDPNHPYMSDDEVLSQYTLKSYYLNLDSDDTYIEINPSENKWRYCGATNASESSSYWGCDANGNIMTSNWMPEYMFVYSLSDIEDPTKFDGTEQWKCRYLDNNKESCSLSITDKSNFILYLPNGDEVVKVIDGEPIIYQSNVKFQSYVGYIEGEEKNCGGKLIIPYKEFDIEYLGGDDISVIDEDSVINVACNGKAMLDFSMEDNTVHIGSVAKNQVIIQITDVASESGYTSVYVEGNLSANDSLLFSLKGNKLLLDEEIEGESKLNVYTDNDSHQNEIYITTLSSKSTDIEIENIREMTYVNKISGSIVNYGDSTDTIIRLLKDSSVVQEVAGRTTYELTDVVSGTYTLEVSKANHVTRTYEITVADNDVVQDVKLHLLGDVTGDGNVNTIDVNRVYAHVRGTNLLTGYELQCANVAGSGETVNTIDVNRIYAHIKETNLLW